MTFLRLLSPQGIAGLAVATILGLLLIAAKVDARHWKKQSSGFEQLYRAEAKAHAETTAQVTLATERARAADRANAERVRAAQSSITQRIANDYESRLAAARARARAERLRLPSQAAPDFGDRGVTRVPAVPGPAGVSPESAGQDRLSQSERLIATEQAIQLDELIEWVRAQMGVDRNPPTTD